MKLNTIFTLAYILSFILLIIGLLFKIQHWPNGTNILLSGLVVTLIYIFTGIILVLSDPYIDNPEKAVWVLGFISFSVFAGLLFLVSKPLDRKKDNQLLSEKPFNTK